MFEFSMEYRAYAQHIASILLGLAMWRWGGGVERAIALVFVGLFTLPILVSSLLVGSDLLFFARGVPYAAIDILAALAFTAIALNANRNYPLWVAGFQVVALTANAMRFVIDAITPFAYTLLVVGPSYFQLAIMAAGLVRHIQRKRRFGSYRDWRISTEPPWSLAGKSNP